MGEPVGFAVAYTTIEQSKLKLWTSNLFESRQAAADSIVEELGRFRSDYYHLQIVEVVPSVDPAEADKARLAELRALLQANAANAAGAVE